MPNGILTSPRTAIMASFGAFGAMVGTFSGSVPQVIAQHGLDEASFGFGVTLMTAATIGSMGLAGSLARLASHRNILIVALPLFLAMLSLLLGHGSFVQFFAFAILFGLVSGIVDVIMNAEAGAIEIALGKRVFTAFHGAASLFVAIFAILSSLISTNFGTGYSVMVAAIPVIAAMVLVGTNIADVRLPNRIGTPDAKRKTVFSRRLILIGVAAGIVISCEVTALFWSSSLLAKGAPQLASIAGMGAALFGLSNAMMRFAGDGLRARFDEATLMSLMVMVAIIGFVGLSLADSFIANLFFFALVGFGVAILCPCLFAWAGLESPANRAAGLSVAMIVAGLPRIAMPTIIGMVSEMYSTRIAFVICAVALVGALLVIRTIARHAIRAA